MIFEHKSCRIIALDSKNIEIRIVAVCTVYLKKKALLIKENSEKALWFEIVM